MLLRLNPDTVAKAAVISFLTILYADPKLCRSSDSLSRLLGSSVSRTVRCQDIETDVWLVSHKLVTVR